MNILFVVHAYSPSRGGVQVLIQELAERLANRHGDQVTVFTTTAYSCELFIDSRQPSLPPGRDLINGVPVRRFAVFNRLTWLRLAAARLGYKLRLPGQDVLRGLYFGPIIPGFTAAIAGANADVIVASSFPMIHMYDALKAAHRTSRPIALIGTVHPTDTWSYDLPRMFRAARQADAYIALSSYERDFMVSRQVPSTRIQVAGGGVDLERFEAPDVAVRAAELRRQQGWGDEPVIAMVGRLTAYKRADVILQAMQRVWQAFPGARFMLAGAATEHTASLRRQIAALPAEQSCRVTLIENFNDHDKPVLYAASDMLVQPSDRESFGIVLLEAWAAGKPVIGVRDSAASSFIDDGQDGLLARYGEADDWANAMKQLCAAPPLRVAMGNAGREKVRRQYTWDVIVSRFRDIFQSVRDGGRVPFQRT